MKQQEYLAAIAKQQSLIRKLFSNRQRRSEVIQEVTLRRYGHLLGKFFRPKPDGEMFRDEDGRRTYYIIDVRTLSNYVSSEEVNIELICRCPYLSRAGADNRLRGVYFESVAFRFRPEHDLDKILAPLYVLQDKAVAELTDACDEFIKSYLKKS